jgi:hypothetical protein
MRLMRPALVTLTLAGAACGNHATGTTHDLSPMHARDMMGASSDLAPLPTDPCVAAGTCPPGTWVNVSPGAMSAVLRPTSNVFGPGTIAGNPARPSDLYVGGSSAGLWKSTDYGNTWTLLDSTLPDTPRGKVIAVAGTTPPTIWWAGYNVLYKSTDDGATFQQITTANMSLYSIEIDPYDTTHLVSGLHEADGIVESVDGGATWKLVGGSGFPSGGISWYPFFVDTGSAATTRKSWFAIAQDGASAVITSDEGASWTIPTGLSGLQHPHGVSALYQNGATLFVAGLYGPNNGQGVFRSSDRGATWTRVDSGNSQEAFVWGTAKNVYAMWSWACSGCNLGTAFESAPQPGTSWSSQMVPAELVIGPNSVVVTSDGVHNIFVALMWDQGLWRYVEP